MKKTVFLTVFLLMIATNLRADALSDLKAAISQLKGTEAIKGTIRLDRTSSTGEGDEAKNEQAQVTFPFSDGQQGLTMIYPPGLLDRAEVEEQAQSANPELTTPLGNTLRTIDPLDISEALDIAPALRRLFDRSTLVSATPTTRDGRAARLIVLRVNPRLSKAQAKRVKKMEMTLRVTAGEDNVPLAAEMSSQVKASILLMTIEQKESSSWTFARRGDRLVAVRSQEEQSGSGLGQKASSKTITTVSLE
jgi:hypothetical protein